MMRLYLRGWSVATTLVGLHSFREISGRRFFSSLASGPVHGLGSGVAGPFGIPEPDWRDQQGSAATTATLRSISLSLNAIPRLVQTASATLIRGNLCPLVTLTHEKSADARR